MPFNIADARINLKSFDLKKLFNQMGWDYGNQTVTIPVNGENFKLTMFAQKRGLAAFTCASRADGSLPDYATRCKVEAQLRKSFHEHLIIFTNKDKFLQKWHWVRREPGKPIVRREYDKVEVILYHLQTAVFELDEEDDLTIIEVGQRVKKAFDIEKVTKRFYDRFKDEHAAFLKFIEGIPEEHLQRWYVSVTLNRLMFVYFIQSKDFLDNDPRYLKNHLKKSKVQGKDLFYSDFLCPLFFDGFAKKEHTAEVKKLFGTIPYLNGGIFERHQIEELYGEKIKIPDKAFEQLFNFFDEWRWHLDERPNKNDREINPDVLGYIFEKYINQKQMGAYYTKEDITEYISKNTVIPHIFDVTQKECKVAFEGEGSIWRHLQADPERYIYPAIRYGAEVPLPVEIAVGLEDPKRREGWNRPAPAEVGLPTEIWREVVARRRRYQEVKEKLAGGAVTSINDLITFNLDIRQFAQDVIEDSDADLLTAFWHALTQIKILDPTVGSGAFLFAALNVLEPMYSACLERMTALVKELDTSNEKHSPKKYEHFRKALEQVHERTNEAYFIFKSIIINNLYGVDIMDEAVEICKLRLFLKLAAQVEPDPSKENFGIEPLPDIDFNIRPGNTLVGFATREDVKRSVQFGTLDGVQTEKLFAMDDEKDQLQLIEQKAEEVDRLYKAFRLQQTAYGGEVTVEDKKALEKKLNTLGDELNLLLARQYAIHNPKGEEYKEFLESHRPFHWFVEFYGIMNEGGFDVIIGNPPYLEVREIDYAPQGFITSESDAVHAMCMERSVNLLNKNGCVSMIVPLALVSTQRMQMVQRIVEQGRSCWYANFSWRPGKLFDTVNRALTIFIANFDTSPKTFSTTYQKWTSDTRNYLMPLIEYVQVMCERPASWVPKLGNIIESKILEKMLGTKIAVRNFVGRTENRIYYRTTGGLYWKVFTDFAPAFRVNGKDGHSTRETRFSTTEEKFVQPIIAVLSSNLFWWWYTITSNCRDLNPYDIQNFPIPKSTLYDEEIARLGKTYISEIRKNSAMAARIQKQTGHTETQSFKIQKSKPIIDEIDYELARHYGLTEEELDFIINYDIKYRMGSLLEEEEE